MDVSKLAFVDTAPDEVSYSNVHLEADKRIPFAKKQYIIQSTRMQNRVPVNKIADILPSNGEFTDSHLDRIHAAIGLSVVLGTKAKPNQRTNPPCLNGLGIYTNYWLPM